MMYPGLTHCIHGRPIPEEGEGGWCPDCKRSDLKYTTAPWWLRMLYRIVGRY